MRHLRFSAHRRASSGSLAQPKIILKAPLLSAIVSTPLLTHLCGPSSQKGPYSRTGLPLGYHCRQECLAARLGLERGLHSRSISCPTQLSITLATKAPRCPHSFVQKDTSLPGFFLATNREPTGCSVAASNTFSSEVPSDATARLKREINRQVPRSQQREGESKLPPKWLATSNSLAINHAQEAAKLNQGKLARSKNKPTTTLQSRDGGRYVDVW